MSNPKSIASMNRRLSTPQLHELNAVGSYPEPIGPKRTLRDNTICG